MENACWRGQVRCPPWSQAAHRPDQLEYGTDVTSDPRAKILVIWLKVQTSLRRMPDLEGK